MSRLLDDARQMLREMPWVGALLLITLVCSLRLHAAVISQADAEDLRFIAKCDKTAQSSSGNRGTDPMARENGAKVPGFKVSFGWREYSVELNVPAQYVRTMLEGAQSGFQRGIQPLTHGVA
jgi:hypothetical protein